MFSRLDVKGAYWHVRLDQRTCFLTTRITPFGRFRWTRLAFGLKVSREIFQKFLDGVLTDLDGTFPIADDIIAAGCGTSDAEAAANEEKKEEKTV